MQSDIRGWVEHLKIGNALKNKGILLQNEIDAFLRGGRPESSNMEDLYLSPSDLHTCLER
jgi:hypothetical protein